MPRSRLPRLTSITDGSFEPSKRNPISLRNDEPLDSHLKQLKVGEHTTPLELSEEELRVNGDIFINGKFKSNKIETVGGKYLDLIGSYIRMYTPSVDAGKETEFAFATNGALVIDVKDSFNVDSDTDMTLTANEDDFHFYGGGSNAVDLYFRFDSNNYCLLNVADSGVTTLSTVDSDGTVGHLTIQPDGDLVLDPVSQKILINATDALYFDGGTHTSIRESSDDTLSFVVGGTNLVDMIEASTNQVNLNSSELSIDAAKKLFFDGGGLGNTYITESSADILDVYVGGDKMLALDEANDKVSIGATNWVAGTVSGGTITEFSATNSAYAGMILGYTRLQGDLSTQGSFEIQNALTVEDDTHKVTFATPPSEEVEIEATFFINFVSTSTSIHCGLSTANATDGYASVAVQFEYDAHGHPISDGEADDGVYVIKWILSAGQ